jgi:hypothetical protein
MWDEFHVPYAQCDGFTNMVKGTHGLKIVPDFVFPFS